jgi:hypothetical protein
MSLLGSSHNARFKARKILGRLFSMYRTWKITCPMVPLYVFCYFCMVSISRYYLSILHRSENLLNTGIRRKWYFNRQLYL